ncbi:hypothetical protein J6590_056439 [Homalodisca vitripennis]|nr:hypothetical protein J6590_056439 [Homalodisca vitripennis]
MGHATGATEDNTGGKEELYERGRWVGHNQAIEENTCDKIVESTVEQSLICLGPAWLPTSTKSLSAC